MTNKNLSNSNIVLILILIVVVFTCYYQTLNYTFVWDDQELYINSNNISADEPFKKVAEHFVPKKGKMYIPATYFCWSLITYLSGNKFSPNSFHLFNIILHILNSIIVYFLLSKFLKSNFSAFFAALVFSLHPIQVESVAWISEARGLLSAFFGFSAILLSISSENKTNLSNWIVILFLLILSILAKPSGIVFPFLLILSKWYLNRTPNVITQIKWYLPYVILVVPFLIITIYGEAPKVIEFEIPLFLRPLFWLNAIGFYVQKLVLPFGFSPGYGLNYNFLYNNPTYFYYVIFGFLVLIIGIKIKHKKEYWFSVLFFLIGFFPVSNLASFYYQYWSTVADRYVYVSVFGFSYLLGFVFDTLPKKARNVVSIVVPFGLFLISLTELNKWRDEFNLWNESINDYPNRIPQVYLGRGVIFEKNGEIHKALDDYTKAIELDSSFYFGFYNRGNIYYDLRKYDLAIEDFTKVLKSNFKFVNAYVNRGLCFLEKKDYKNAIKDFQSALRLDPNQPDVYVYLGEALEGNEQFKDALEVYQRALSFGLKDSVLILKIENLKNYLK